MKKSIAPNNLYLFKTTIGYCGIAWNACGLTKVQLPGKSKKDTLSLMTSDAAIAMPTDQLPQWIMQAVTLIQTHLAGDVADLTQIPLDLNHTSPFFREVYQVSRVIPSGSTVTYQELARMAKRPKAARACGSAMAKNPFPILVPCHRVVPAAGGLGHFSATGGTSVKRKLLRIEGV